MAKATKKATKKTTKSATKPSVSSSPALDMNMAPTMDMPSTRPVMNSKYLTWGLVVVVVGLLTYKLGPWLVPAIVDNSPVTRFELYSRLENSYGAQALDDMINEKILDQAISKSGVKVDSAKVEEQLKALETQFESTGGLDEALLQRGLSRKDLEKQIRTQLAVEIILADQVQPTDEEIKAQFDSGSSSVYKDASFEEVKGTIAEELTQTKLRDAFLEWFAEVKKEAKVKSFDL